MRELKKPFKKLTQAEIAALDAAERNREIANRLLPPAEVGSNGLRRGLISVPERMMDIAKRAMHADQVWNYIANGGEIRPGLFIDENGNRNFYMEDGTRYSLPVDCGTTPEIVRCASSMEPEVESLKPETQVIESSVKAGERSGEAVKAAKADFIQREYLKKQNEDKESKKKQVEELDKEVKIAKETLAIEENGSIISFPEYGIAVQLVEIQRMYTDDEEKISTTYIFLVKTYTSEQEIMISGDKLQDLEWLKKAADGLLYLDAKTTENIKKQLIAMVLNAAVKETRKYESGGWKKVDNEWKYVLANGVVSMPDYPVIGNKKYKFPPHENISEVKIFQKIMEMTTICKTSHIMLVLMLYVQLSFLATIFSHAGAAVKFIITLVGETNSRKTTLALLLAKIFVANEKLPDVTFTATPGGIEKAIYECGDCCMVLDDMKPGTTKAENREMAKMLELVTRLFGDRTPKKRMTGYGSDSELQVGGGCIVTGEHIDGVESSRTRRINLLITRDDVNNQLLSEFQKVNYWPTYLYNWLGYVTQNIHDIISFIKTEFSSLRRQGKFKIDRRNDQFAQLSISAWLFLSYGVYCTAIQYDEVGKLYEKIKNMILLVLCQNEEETKSLSICSIMLEGFSNYAQQYAEPIGVLEMSTEKIYQDETFFFVTIELFLTIANRYAEKVGAGIVLPSGRLLPKMLDEENIIEVRMEGEKIRRTLHLPGYGTGTRFLWISKSNLQKYIAQIEQ